MFQAFVRLYFPMAFEHNSHISIDNRTISQRNRMLPFGCHITLSTWKREWVSIKKRGKLFWAFLSMFNAFEMRSKHKMLIWIIIRPVPIKWPKIKWKYILFWLEPFRAVSIPFSPFLCVFISLAHHTAAHHSNDIEYFFFEFHATEFYELLTKIFIAHRIKLGRYIL